MDSDEYDDFEIDVAMLPWLETPLDLTQPCIRVLILEPGPIHSPITCKLKVVSLDEYPEYQTLSYVWGDSKHTKAIAVSGVIFNVTYNLFDFLTCLRQPAAAQTLWVDAVCIDQTNDEEKGWQIGLMTRIYRQAKEAHIWFGKFTDAWTDELKHEEPEYLPACEMSPSAWRAAEEAAREELGLYMRAGGKPIREQELQGLDTPILCQALAVFDSIRAGSHLYDFPLFLVNEGSETIENYVLNRHWLTIIDCFRWLVSRPWWTRVWTLQEAVLPRVDPIVHAPPHSFRLSRLLHGQQAESRHSMGGCCLALGRLFHVAYFNNTFFSNIDAQARAVHRYREIFAEEDRPRISPVELMGSAQSRKATAPKDHLFGILGLFNQDLQSGWFAAFGYSSTATEAFSRFSKLCFHSRKDLLMLDEARGVRNSKIGDLPSWAIDMSAEGPYSGELGNRWGLFNAAPNTFFEKDTMSDWCHLDGSSLIVQGFPIGTVGKYARELSAYEKGYIGTISERNVILVHVIEWYRLFMSSAGISDLDRFWRTVCMDRNIWWHPMHERTPLPAERLSNIKLWWRSWSSTRDHLDLAYDTRYGEDNKRGTYHYRALKLNFDKHLFFCTASGEPGMGPLDVQPADEIFALQGCPALAILRQREDGAGFQFVGLCFVDGWMYGAATRKPPEWQSLTLY